jgi:hypothetical protein
MCSIFLNLADHPSHGFKIPVSKACAESCTIIRLFEGGRPAQFHPYGAAYSLASPGRASCPMTGERTPSRRRAWSPILFGCLLQNFLTDAINLNPKIGISSLLVIYESRRLVPRQHHPLLTSGATLRKLRGSWFFRCRCLKLRGNPVRRQVAKSGAAPATVSGKFLFSYVTDADAHWEDWTEMTTREPGDLPRQNKCPRAGCLDGRG